MFELVEHLAKRLFEVMKVDGKSLLVQPFRGHGHGHAPVVTVQLLALALIAAQLMGCREFGFNHELIHCEKIISDTNPNVNK